MVNTKAELNRYFDLIDRRVPIRVSRSIRWLRKPTSFGARLIAKFAAIVLISDANKNASKLDGCANFLPVFSTRFENFLKNVESNQWLKTLFSLVLSPWCPWPESNQHSLRNSILSRARLPVPPQGPSVAGQVPGAAKRAEYSGRPARVNPRGCDCGASRHVSSGGIGRWCLFEHELCSGECP